MVDPSHATGHSELVEPMTLSSIMAGCDGLEIEVHNTPILAKSDKEQQLTPLEFKNLMINVRKVLALRKEISNK